MTVRRIEEFEELNSVELTQGTNGKVGWKIKVYAANADEAAERAIETDRELRHWRVELEGGDS